VKAFFPVAGILALAWFAIRVIPQPGRIAYPCQRFAAATFGGYLAALAAVGLGLARYLRKGLALVKTHAVAVGGFLAVAGTVAAVAGFAMPSCQMEEQPGDERNAVLRAGPTAQFESDAYADKTVVRVYDPAVTSFKVGTTDISYYWHTFDQAKLRGMLETALIQITGAASVADAWKAILPGLSATSKIAVKANMNDVGFYPNDWYRSAVTDPAMMIVLAKSLVAAGAQEANITIFDTSRNMPNVVKDEVHKDCPGVVLQGTGMALSNYTINFGDIGKSFKVPQAVMDADFLLDLFLFKHHSGATSASMKNLAGIAGSPADILHPQGNGYENSQMLGSLTTDPEIKKRLKLSIGEAIFGCQDPTEYLNKSVLNKTDFFPNKLASSLFVSRNPFLIDNVMVSFMNVEKKGDPKIDDGGTGWLSKSVGKSPTWVKEAIHCGSIVDGATGMPPKDLAFDPTVIEFISLPNSGGSVTPDKPDASVGTGGAQGTGGATGGNGGAVGTGGNVGGTTGGTVPVSSGGTSGGAGSSGSGGQTSSSAGSGSGGHATGGSTGSGGQTAGGGTSGSGKGGSKGSSSATGGSSGGTKSTSTTTTNGSSGGCSIGNVSAQSNTGLALPLFGLVLGLLIRRRARR
jgi:MYXO-CTERM domain-containing protein